MKSISRLPIIVGRKSKEQPVHLHVPRPRLPRDPFPGISRELRFPTIDGRYPVPVDMTNIAFFATYSTHIHLCTHIFTSRYVCIFYIYNFIGVVHT